LRDKLITNVKSGCWNGEERRNWKRGKEDEVEVEPFEVFMNLIK
jgi:hypothetical protein